MFVSDKTPPTVTVNIPPKEHVTSVVTLVCLVSGAVQQDYYIAWTEDEGENVGYYKGGTELVQKNDSSGYIVASVYKTTVDKWKTARMFSCHVWPFGSSEPMRSVTVSRAMSNSVECD